MLPPTCNHQQTYETTTLGVVFFTTLVCGGLTETVLKRAGMRREAAYTSIVADGEDDMDQQSWEHMKLLDATLPSGSSPRERGSDGLSGMASSTHRLWRAFDNRFMKPMFGGRCGEDDDRLVVGDGIGAGGDQ